MESNQGFFMAQVRKIHTVCQHGWFGSRIGLINFQRVVKFLNLPKKFQVQSSRMSVSTFCILMYELMFYPVVPQCTIGLFSRTRGLLIEVEQCL